MTPIIAHRHVTQTLVCKNVTFHDMSKGMFTQSGSETRKRFSEYQQRLDFSVQVDIPCRNTISVGFSRRWRVGEMRCQLQRWRRQLITLANLSRKLTYSLLTRRFTIALQWRIYIVKFWTLPGSKFFQFHAVFGKIWQNRMLAPPGQLAPPPRGNPGSATALKPRALPTKKVQYLQRTFP